MNSASPKPPSSSFLAPAAPDDAPLVSGSWQYNGFTLSWETSDPYSVTLTAQGAGAPGSYTLQRNAPVCQVAEAPLKMEAKLDFASQIQMGSSGPASIILSIQLSQDILFRTNIGGWTINKSSEHPDTLSPWWPAQPAPPEADEPLPKSPPQPLPLQSPAPAPKAPEHDLP